MYYPLPSYAISPYKFGTTQYIDLIKRWSNYKQERKRIAIVGAGLAGLMAGRLLKQLDHHIEILEANNVVGGRVKTLRSSFTRDFYAEAGAMRIPAHHRLTLHMIETFGLETIPFSPSGSGDNGIIFLNNESSTFGEYKSRNHFHFPLSVHEKGRGADDLMKDCITNFMFDPNGGNWPEFTFEKLRDDSALDEVHRVMKTIDKFSLRTFLKEVAHIKSASGEKESLEKLTDSGADYICAIMALEMSLPSSMSYVLHMLRTLFDQDDFRQIKGGMDLLPKAFLTDGNPNKDLSNNITYNARVTEFELSKGAAAKKKGQVKIEWENPITRVADHGYYDLVVIALPFSALRHIRMNNLATDSKKRSMRQLHYENACKIIIEFDAAFWGDLRQPISGGKSITDLPIRQTIYPNPAQNDNNVLLASYTWGDDSLRWTSLRPDDRIRFALRDLAKVHNMDLGQLEKLFKSGTSHSWAEQGFCSGAFAVFEPYQCTELFEEEIWKPDKWLHYCGEHTSTKHGWIEGALESGVRVAKEIIDRIDDRQG